MAEQQQQRRRRPAAAEAEEDDPFKKGSVVEVSFEEEGFRGSWYTATALRSYSKKNNKILLEFHNLMADEKSSKPLREFVNIILVRPVPPRESSRYRFKLSDEVDAYHNDGWWEGIITAVSPESDSYSVFFRSSREQIEFPHSQLRLHREWVHGNWVPPLQPEPGEKAEPPPPPPPPPKPQAPRSEPLTPSSSSSRRRTRRSS